MLPGTLAPLDPRKTRALTTIYAPRKPNTRKNRTAQTRMLENDIPIKPTLTPFHPLPAIGQKLERQKTKVIVVDLNKNESLRAGATEKPSVKIHDVLQPLTPLRIHGYERKSLLEQDKPQQLLRENTYDVIEPIYLSAVKIKKRDTSINRRSMSTEKEHEEPKVSPKTRFKKAAMQVAKMPETGKLLCLRERQTLRFSLAVDDQCKLQELPQSPAQKLNKISEIFQNLDLKGRQKDKMKKENSWF